MFHEFIDSKRKKITGTNNGKSYQNSIENCTAEQSGNEWPSTTFIPTWLNNLGLKLKNNHMYAAFDLKTEKLHSDIKNQNQYEQNEYEKRKQSVDEDESKKSCYFESSQKGYGKKSFIQTSEPFQKFPSVGKQNRQETIGVSQIPVIWRVRPKVANMESSSTDSVNRPPSSRRKDFKMSRTEMSVDPPGDANQINSDQKTKSKISKKKTRTKHQTVGHTTMLKEIDVNFLLQEKAKEVLENYAKKKVHSTTSEIKRFEAKLILLETKIRLGNLTVEDLRLLDEVKTRAGSKENFDKLMRHVREANLKEVIEAQNCILNSVQTNKDAGDAKTQPKEECKTLISTDDENDIKRFSELLRKNQNEVEKRKCLEEVRNYFERKRRTRLTKCWMLNEASKDSGIKGSEDHANEGGCPKRNFPDRLGADWRSKFKVSDAELVGKAVDETLQKFVELYNFHVSPSIMNSMKNNVLKDIQSHSFEVESRITKHNEMPYNVEEDKVSTKPQKNIIGKDNDKKESLTKDSKANNFKERSLLESHPEEIDADALEKDQMQRLKNELEHCINNKSNDVKKLKVQSILLEQECRDSNSKNKEFIYSFQKQSLEEKKFELIGNVMTTLPLKDVEVQVGKASSAANASTLTEKFITFYEKYIQTEKNQQISVDVQTEGTYAIELKKFKEFDVSPGLYRMIKSKQPGKFYLYPEKEEQPSGPRRESKEHSKSNSFEEDKFGQKRLSEKLRESEADKKEKELLVSEVLTDDEVKPKKDDMRLFLPEKRECAWLWDGETINPGADLKTHVESLLKEKLKEMSYGFRESRKSRLNCNLPTQNFAKARRTESQDNVEFTVLHSGFPLGQHGDGLHFEEGTRNFEEGSAGTQSLGEQIIPTSEEKSLRNASTLNSEQAFFPLERKTGKSSGRSRQSAKTIYLRNNRKKRKKRNRQSRRTIVDLKKAVKLMNECLFEKKMKYGVGGSLKDSTGDSGSSIESNTSLDSKDTSDGRLTIVFGMKNCPTFKNKTNRRMVNERVQTNKRANSIIKSFTESRGSSQNMQNRMHWELIERILHRVNHRERDRLWNDVRELIKSKIGKDINNEDAKEVCIQIEQEGKAKHSVLAKGHYTKNEGNVEVEIDLTLNDLEKIIRHRERNRRRRSLYFRKFSRSLRLTSPRQSGSNFSSIQELRNILKSVSRLQQSQLPGDISAIKMNTEN